MESLRRIHLHRIAAEWRLRELGCLIQNGPSPNQHGTLEGYMGLRKGSKSKDQPGDVTQTNPNLSHSSPSTLPPNNGSPVIAQPQTRNPQTPHSRPPNYPPKKTLPDPRKGPCASKRLCTSRPVNRSFSKVSPWRPGPSPGIFN